MSDTNVCSLVGRLTRDPELSYIGEGTALCKFSIANNDKHKGKDNVSYFDITSFGKGAEIHKQYLRKGTQVSIVGKLRQNSFENKEGKKVSKIEIIASDVMFLGGNKKESGDSSFDFS